VQEKKVESARKEGRKCKKRRQKVQEKKAGEFVSVPP
jgi:hypothetical protein